MSVLPSQDEKAVYVERMFARIAPGYDRMNQIMTFGMDANWRDVVVGSVAPPVDGRVLDVGCGTGTIVEALASWVPQGQVVGVDYTLAMLQEGHGVLDRAPGNASFSCGDALHLPFADNSFDAVTTGFMMRNVTDIGAAFREMYRVVRPGGVIACLEVARPTQPLVRFGHQVYFERIVPLIARAVGADATAYTYLPQSARAFPLPPALAHIMQESGWHSVSFRLLGMGAVAVHTGYKPA